MKWSIFTIILVASTVHARDLVVKNNIQDKMLGYKFIKTYYPVKFSLSINDQPLEQGQAKTIPDSDVFTAKYRAEFSNGRVSTRELKFKAKPEASECKISFSWDNSSRLQVEGAQQIPDKKACP